MRKSTIILLTLLISIICPAQQIVTTNPQFVTQDAGNIEIIFDAASLQGSLGLNNFNGDIYAHIGVITNLSTSGKDWKYVVPPTPPGADNSWPTATNQSLVNLSKNKLLSLGGNKYKLTIFPNIREYFGVPATETIQKIAIVFRNADGTKTGKTSTNDDIFINVYPSGLHVAFINPLANQLLPLNTSLNINVGTSTSVSKINLYINGTIVKTVNTASTLSHTYVFAVANDYTLIAEAINGDQTTRDTVYICVPKPVVNEARPAGIKNGINIIDNSSVTLLLHAPLKSNVFVIGEFNNWLQMNAYQMKKDGEYWWITINGLNPGKIYAYQYLVDGNIKISDPYTELVLDPWNDKWINEKYNIYPNLKAYPEGKTDGLVATLQTSKPAYNWEVPTFKMPDPENMVIYELLLRDFTVEKSLEAAIAKLDYLKTLGITAVELMPIQEFDGNNSWGYNPNHYFAPDKAYGTPEMYKKFIDECHKRGMAVILDIVLNHATGSHPYAKLYWSDNKTSAENPWFNVNATHPYSVFHDYNHSYSGTKDYFKRMVQYWITEYKVDGYRLDLTKGLTQTMSTESTASNYDQSRIDNITAYYDAARSVKSDVMFILEHFCNNDEEMVLANKGMYLWRNINNAYSQTAMGYQSESDFSGMNSSPRNWVGFAESHDEERNFYKAKMWGNGTIATDSLVRIKRVPLNIAFTTLIPGPKMIWQFGEMGYDNSIDSYGGRTSAKPSAWGFLNLAHRKAAYDAASKIITLRRLFPTAFKSGTFSLNIGASDWSNGRRIGLTHNNLNMVVLGNFQTTTITANPKFQKTGIWYNSLTGEKLSVTNKEMSITMQQGDLLIYTDKKIDFSKGIVIPEENIAEDIIYPSFTKGKVFLKNGDTISNVKVFNLQGALLKSSIDVSEVDLSDFKSGMYVFKVETLIGSKIQKVIKY